jgi:site-specific DNA recombinase
MIRAAIYARYSDLNQNDSSIEQQFRLLRSRAEAEGWTVTAEFEDRAYTGTNTFRPGFQAMREAAMNGSFDMILTESVDRLNRDLEDGAGLYKRLRYRGVTIFTLLEGEVNEMTIAFKGGMASMYSKDLGRRVYRGLEQRVLEGASGGGWSYGYDIHRQWDSRGKRVGGNRVINEEQAKIVRRIFTEYANGKSPRKIAHELNAEGVRTQSGGLWRDSTIYGNRRRGTGIINNSLYIGEILWSRQKFTRDPDTGRATGKLNDESKWVRSEAPHLRIVDQELWDRVKSMQRALDIKSVSNAGKQRPKRLFSFLITCGECGGGMAMVSQTGYGCSNARNKGPSVCSNRLCIKEDTLKETVFNALQKHVMHPALCEVFARIYVEHIERVRASNSAAADQNTGDLRKTEQAIEKLADAIASGIDPSLLWAKSEELLARKRQLQHALEQRADAPVFVLPDMSKRYRKAIDEVIASFNQPEHHEQSARRIRDLIDKIVLTPDIERKKLIVDFLGDADGLIRLSGVHRQSTARPSIASKVAEQSELGQIRWLTGRPRHRPPINPACHKRQPQSEPTQVMMVGVTSFHQDLQEIPQPQVVMAGAAGFEPAYGGIKSRCLTAWRRPSSDEGAI